MKSRRNSISKVLICLPKPLYAPAGVIWQISGDLLKCGYDVDEFQFFHVLTPQLLNNQPYACLVSSELLDLSDSTNTDRAILVRAALLLPKSTFIVWDKMNLWEPTDSSNPTNLEVWNDLETNDITKRLLLKLGHSVN